MNINLKISTLNKIRVMGVVYLLCLIVPTLNWMMIASSIHPSEPDILVHILDREALFRFNIFNQVISSVCIFLLGFFLYKCLKVKYHEISLLAFLFKVIESSLTLVIAIIFFISLSLLKAGVIENAVVNGLIGNYVSYTAFHGLFFGISMVLFLILINNRNIIPGWIAVWGILCHVLVIFYDSCVILSIKGIDSILAQIAITGPVGIFQLSVSLLLIFIPSTIVNTTKL